eukprot:m.123384 g.123384  ORF g.123384 m.123384 type:complete len:62 (-) comp13754_c0_seq3:3148-3333(-)
MVILACTQSLTARCLISDNKGIKVSVYELDCLFGLFCAGTSVGGSVCELANAPAQKHTWVC